MSTVLGKWLDIVLLVAVMIQVVFFLPVVFVECSTPIIQQTSDKSVVAEGTPLRIEGEGKTGWDIIYMLYYADEYMTYPRAVRINNTPVIKVTSAWLVNKISNVETICSDYSDWKLYSMRDYRVVSSEFIYNNGDSYIQYILEP